MRKHPEIFSDAALRHIKTGGTKPPGEMTASELPPMAVSWSSTEHLPVGEWKEKAPKYVRGLSPCLTHCPVGNDVEGFVSKVRDNDIETAVKLLLAENPLPATCGRVCYHPCEDGCNRKELDGAVGIRAIERYLGDHPEFKGSDIWQQAKPSSGKKIAVIGSGPSGLACAWGLALLGHKVEVYEQKEKAGGLLRYGIPAYRLPKDVLDREIGRITDVGVKFFYSWKIGEDRIIKDMLAAFDAVFVAAGAVKTRQLGIQGENNNNVWSALDFLNTVANGIIPDIGARCVIIGGGNSAVDAARSARRLGAESTILYRRTCNEMPAHQAEIDDAIAEG